MTQISISAGVDHDIKRFATLAQKILAVAENDADEIFRNPIKKMLECSKDLSDPKKVKYVIQVLNYILDSDLMPIDMVRTAKSIIDTLNVQAASKISQSNRHTKAARRGHFAEQLSDKTQEIREDSDVSYLDDDEDPLI